MKNAVTAWSFSALAVYEQCPLKYKLSKIDKLPEPKSDAMHRGLTIHKKCETYLKGDDPDAIPPELEEFDGLFQELHAFQPIVEQQWGFTQEWTPTGWFSKGKKATWLRVVPDAVVLYGDATAELIDFKTGKPWGDNEDQMDLFANAVLCRYPDIQEVSVRLWYLDTGDERPEEPWIATRKGLRGRLKEWEDRVEPLFSDTEFPATPNSKCGWCHFRKSNGGPCRHG